MGVDGVEPPTLPTISRDTPNQLFNFENKKTSSKNDEVLWELTGSNRRPSACKADALNQLS